MLIAQHEQILIDDNLKKISTVINNISHSRIQKENMKVFDRINNKLPFYSNKKSNDSYMDSRIVRGLRKTFDLPNIDRTT